MTTVAGTSTVVDSPEDITPIRRRFTVEEYRSLLDNGVLAEDERIELLDGEVIVKAPIEPSHEDGNTRLNNQLIHRLYDRAMVRIQQSVRLDDYGLPEPDIAVVRLRDDYHVQHPTPADVLLLVEVADCSLEFDREVKLARYAAAGIPEVWIVNLRMRQVEGHSDPVDGTYRSRRVVTAEGRIGPLAFPDVALAVADFLLE